MSIRSRLKLHKNEQYIPKPKVPKKPKGPKIPKGRTLSDQDKSILDIKINDLRDKKSELDRMKFEASVKLTEEIKNICDECKINTNNRILESVRYDLENFLRNDIDNDKIEYVQALYRNNDFLINLFLSIKEHRFEKCMAILSKHLKNEFNLVNAQIRNNFDLVFSKRFLLLHASIMIYFCIAQIYNCPEEYDDDDYDI